MRVPPVTVARGLSAAWRVQGGAGVVTLRGSFVSGDIQVVLAAIDAALATRPGALVLDGSAVERWSIRGLEIVVLAATMATDRRIGFALCGLGNLELDLIRAHWPGVSVRQFSYADRAAAVAAGAAAIERSVPSAHR